MAEWINPKTNWRKQDYFYLSDWNRIVTNIVYIHDLYGATFQLKDTTLESTDSLPFYDIVNDLEYNLQQLFLVYLDYSQYFPGNIEHTQVTWFPVTASEYTRNPDFTDFNRWEDLLLNLYDWWQHYNDANRSLFAGTFYAGTDYTLQLLSRGR